MGDENNLLNIKADDLAGVGKPIEKFIEKVSEGIAGVAKPWQIKRVARAEAEADIIQAHKEVQLSEIQRRATFRRLEEDTFHQLNLESIAQRSVPLLKSEAQPEKLDREWLAYFFDKARLVSSAEMQTIWAKILAEEANQPGRFSKYALRIVADMEKEDAECFEELRSLTIEISDAIVGPILTGKSQWLSVAKRVQLESFGLISQNHVGFSLPIETEHIITYFDRRMKIKNSANQLGRFRTGVVLYTNIGLQLAHICSGTPIPGYFEYLLEYWKDHEAEEVSI